MMPKFKLCVYVCDRRGLCVTISALLGLIYI